MRTISKTIYFLILALSTCATAQGKESWSVVDCTRKGLCSSIDGERVSPWSQQHETLYWRGIEEILKSKACGNGKALEAADLKLGYQSERRIVIPCADPGISIQYLNADQDLTGALRAGKVEHVMTFKRVQAWITKQGIEVQVSISYFGKPVKEGMPPNLEGIDTYLIVRMGRTVEVRLASRLAT